MDEDKKIVRVEFAPGCFDQFDGSQEELDDLVKQIQEMFAGKTRDEIESMSQFVGSEEDIEEFIQADKARNLQ